MEISRKLTRLAMIAGLTGLIALTIWPYHDGALRYGLPMSLLLTLSAGWWFLRKTRWRFATLLPPLLIVIPFCLPAKPIDPVTLRTSYVAAMGRLEGVRYIWGGESRWGIDCSGLPRRGLRDALWEEGWRNGNGAAFREWARQWWFDTSAKAMREGHKGFTRPTGVAGRLRDLKVAELQPGDLAVTADGRHVMIYFGSGKWIQADPMAAKVTIALAEERNYWFISMVTVHRWALLE